MTNWLTVQGIIQQGHQVASGRSPTNPYPKGTIELQTPFFRELGLDISEFFAGTLNISIAPHTYQIKNPKYTFLQVDWTRHHPPENFSFSPCYLIYQQTRNQSLIYYPHPETKRNHWQDHSILEVLAPYIADIAYGKVIELEVNTEEIAIL